jgi:hypothetical protein
MRTLGFFEISNYLRIPQNDFENKFRNKEYKGMPHKIINGQILFDKNEVLKFLDNKFKDLKF